MQFVKVFAQLGDPKRAPYPVVVTQRVVNPRVAQRLRIRRDGSAAQTNSSRRCCSRWKESHNQVETDVCNLLPG